MLEYMTYGSTQTYFISSQRQLTYIKCVFVCKCVVRLKHIVYNYNMFAFTHIIFFFYPSVTFTEHLAECVSLFDFDGHGDPEGGGQGGGGVG